MRNFRVLVVGLTRGSAHYLQSEVSRLQRTFQVETNLDFFVVESDSDDETVKVLRGISKNHNQFNFVSLGNLREFFPNRIQRLQHCRNRYVEYIRTFPRDTWDLVIVADLDGINSKLANLNLEALTNLDFEWAGLMANQSAPYYDILALRAKGWVEEDCFMSLVREKTQLEQLIKSTRKGTLARWKLNRRIGGLRRKHIYSKMLKLPTSKGFISVESAFGGLAVYKPEVFFEANYGDPIQNQISECEHVLFHVELIRKGFKLFIKLDLINSGWNEHSLNKIHVVRIFRRLKHLMRKYFQAI